MEMGAGYPGQLASILRTRNEGVAPTRKFAGAGQESREPEVCGGSGKYSGIIWTARRRRPTKCADHGGSGWAHGVW